jgi:hypothetical protein
MMGSVVVAKKIGFEPRLLEVLGEPPNYPAALAGMDNSPSAASACSCDVASQRRPTRRACGKASRNNSMRFPANSSWLTKIPVELLPGRERLVT